MQKRRLERGVYRTSEESIGNGDGDSAHIEKFLELNADETDHQAIIADLLLEAAAGQSADQTTLVSGVE